MSSRGYYCPVHDKECLHWERSWKLSHGSLALRAGCGEKAGAELSHGEKAQLGTPVNCLNFPVGF